METDFFGPALLPWFGTSIQSEHGSKHSDLHSELSDHHSELSRQPQRVCSSRAKKHLDKKKHKVLEKYFSQSSSSEEDQSSVSTAKWYKVGQACFEGKLQELNTDFAKICFSPKPSGAPVGKVPLQILKELEHQARQNLSTINFAATFAETASCNTTMEKCRDSLKSTFIKIKSQIQKGANPEKAARRGYENACDYLEMLNKRILIQQRALACLSKSLARILQRELYTMGNTGLLRREAEMTLLEPHLRDLSCQELRYSSFWPAPFFKSQFVGWRRLPP